jgi:hypothetical protein
MPQDADAILADCRDLVEQHGLHVETTRRAIKERKLLTETPDDKLVYSAARA